MAKYCAISPRHYHPLHGCLNPVSSSYYTKPVRHCCRSAHGASSSSGLRDLFWTVCLHCFGGHPLAASSVRWCSLEWSCSLFGRNLISVTVIGPTSFCITLYCSLLDTIACSEVAVTRQSLAFWRRCERARRSSPGHESCATSRNWRSTRWSPGWPRLHCRLCGLVSFGFVYVSDAHGH